MWGIEEVSEKEPRQKKCSVSYTNQSTSYDQRKLVKRFSQATRV